VRYNGNRGAYDYLPQHPEIFIGFTDNDPRGAQLDPLMNEMRGHTTARAENIESRMGNNADNHLAERPWTNASISYGMKENQRRLKDSTRIFSQTIEGRPFGSNSAVDSARFGATANANRAGVIGGGGEGLADGGAAVAGARFRTGDSGAAPAEGGAGRLADGGAAAGAGKARTWRHVRGSADLGRAAVAQSRGAGRAAGDGSVAQRAAGGDAALAASVRGRATNRKTLAASAGLAARHRRAVQSGVIDQVRNDAASTANSRGAQPAGDAARVRRAQTGDAATARALGAIDEGTVAGSTATGLQPRDTGAAARRIEAGASRNAYLTNAAAIVTGLRAGTQNVAGKVILTGLRAAEREDLPATRRALGAPTDTSRAARATDGATGPIAAAARGLAVHVYGSGTPAQRRSAGEAARVAFDPVTSWRQQRETQRRAQKALPEWRGGAKTGGITDNDFSANDEVAGRSTVLGSKKLRATAGSSESSVLSDEPIGSTLDDA
jgi:hypothetical protein